VKKDDCDRCGGHGTIADKWEPKLRVLCPGCGGRGEKR
jgi:DnaJ-class molecular chaperone